MSTSFPTNLDTSATIPVEGAAIPLSTNHVTTHQNIQDAIEAIEAKVGADSSAVTTSHDYKLSEVTDKAAGKTATQTLTNKTLTSPVINVGSDATGDMYYRNAGVLTRIPVGTDNQIMKLNGTTPNWEAETTVIAATESAEGISRLATAAQITAGTASEASYPLVVTPDQLALSNYNDNTFFGDGSDGDVTIGSNTSLSRDMYYDNLVVSTTFTLTTNGYRIFARSITLNGTGKIDFSGSAGGAGGTGTQSVSSGTGGAGGTAGTAGTALSDGTIAGGKAGVVGVVGGAGGSTGNAGLAGSTGTSGVASSISIGSAGNSGNSGGTSGLGAGGAAAGGGGGGTGGTKTDSNIKPRIAPWAVHLYDINGTSVTRMLSSAGSASGGSGGGGGGSSGGGGGVGGGGGGGSGGSGSTGGVIMISAKTITIGASASITANGGAGGAGGTGGAGNDIGGNTSGGGGGGAGGNGGTGGVIVLVYRTLNNSGSIAVNGGSGGAAGSGGASGGVGANAGSAGTAGATGATGVIYQVTA